MAARVGRAVRQEMAPPLVRVEPVEPVAVPERPDPQAPQGPPAQQGRPERLVL